MSNNKRLLKQSAIVTGAAGGIGEGIARIFAREGASVAIADINIQDAKRVASEIEEMGGSAVAIQVDLTRFDDVSNMVKDAVARLRDVTILVNNAGGFTKTFLIDEYPEDEWDRVVALNLKSVFFCCKAVTKHMMEKRKGRIINIASRTAWAPNPGGPDSLAYGASKAGVVGFTRLLAKQLGPYGITVNSISPGTTVTARIKKIRDPEGLKKVAETSPLGKLLDPSDIGEAALFLASEGARYITGINLNVNAGTFMI
jgi:3-oxoacyl-[acyl-carrier protein] reductase